VADIAGPLLVRAGLITKDQLLAAHEQRRQGGATLAETLIASGVLNEEALVAFYRQRLLVPRVGWAELGKVSPKIIAKLPPEIAAEFRVVPLDFDREQNLTVAMADPSDAHAVDEIGFFTGAFVMRAVAAPSVIAWALYHFYQVTTPLLPRLMARFPGAPPQAAAGGATPTLVSGELPANRPPPPQAPPPPVGPPATASGEIPARKTKPQAIVVSDPAAPIAISETPSGAAVLLDRAPRRTEPMVFVGEPKVIISSELTPPPAPMPRPPARAASDPGKPKPKALIIDDAFGEDTPIPQPVPMDITGQQWLLDVEHAPTSAPPAPPTVSAIEALTAALETLRFAEDRDAVTGALVGYMARLCRRAAFFAMKKGELVGWQGVGPGIQLEELKRARLRLDRPSALRDIAQARLPYRGPLADPPSRDFLIEALGGYAPDHALLVPVALRGKVVGIIYGDDELEPVPDEHIRQLAAEASNALETVLVAKKSQ
jgi:hypothetical protein